MICVAGMKNPRARSWVSLLERRLIILAEYIRGSLNRRLPVKSGIALLSGILLFAIQAAAPAQEPSLEELPGLRERAVVMSIVSRVIERNQNVVWNSENSRVTIPGRPVGLKLVGENLVVEVQFTPFLRHSGRHTLVAQTRIWITIPDEGISYNTTMQTIPLEFGETVYFFPLGTVDNIEDEEARIEIQLVLEPYFNTESTAVNVEGREITSP